MVQNRKKRYDVIDHYYFIVFGSFLSVGVGDCYSSARLYKTVTGLKVAAVFCMCLDHPLYTKVCIIIMHMSLCANGVTGMQHCDKVIPEEHPYKVEEKTRFNKQIINSDKVQLILEETKTWTLIMDRSEVASD